MTLWESMTGNDITAHYQEFETRARSLPPDHQTAWERIKAHLTPYGDFTGRNLLPILDNALSLLEETADRPVSDVLGDDLPTFCAALARDEGAHNLQDRWGNQLNRNVTRKLNRLKGRQ